MQIETYEATEMNDVSSEIDSEAQALIDKLGLDGQKTLTKVDSDRRPYTEMTAEELAVYRCLYPEVATVQAYARGPIPVRVLQVISYCRENSFFEHLSIWSPAGRDPDPLLVGYNGNDWNPREICLLARWGDALDTFENLSKRAAEKKTREYESKLKQVIQRCQAALADPSPYVLTRLAGKSIADPWNF